MPINYPPDLQQRYNRSERRKRLLEQLLQQSVQPEQTQYAGRLAVPYNPLQGLTKIAQAMLARKGLTRAETEQQDVAEEYKQGRQAAMDRVMSQMQGQPQQGGPLRGITDYQQFKPAVPPDLPGAAMTAVSDPYLSGDRGTQAVLTALLKNRMRGQGSRSRPIPTSSGYYEETDQGWKPMLGPDKKPLLPVPADARTQERVSFGKKVGGMKGEIAASQNKVISSIKSLESKTDMLNRKVDEAINDTSMWTTGLMGSLSWVPGTPIKDLAETLETIKANIGFDRLQEMRENSPTGGALGQVSEFENKLLQAVNSSLSNLQSPDKLKQNLEEVKRLINERQTFTYDAYQRDYGEEWTPAKPQDKGPDTDKKSVLDEADAILGL